MRKIRIFINILINIINDKKDQSFFSGGVSMIGTMITGVLRLSDRLIGNHQVLVIRLVIRHQMQFKDKMFNLEDKKSNKEISSLLITTS